MKISLIDLVRQYRTIKDEVLPAVESIFEKGVFILGENVERFEAEAALYCQAKYGVGVASGSDALELALKALGVGEGDEVITTPFTFIATAEAVCANGARPVFVDIDLQSYNIDPLLIEKKITKKTKAIIPVHLFGYPADMDAILNIAKTHNLLVIEDCAQAMGADINSKRVGSIGNLGCFSFFPSKNLAGYGDGGMIATSDKALYDKLKMLRVHGAANKYNHEFKGRNSRLDELQAAILRIKLRYLDEWNNLRRNNARIYSELFVADKLEARMVLPVEKGGCHHVYNVYSIRYQKREELKAYLSSQGVSTAVYYPIPLHLQKVYQFLGCKKGDFPVSERVSDEILALPIYPELKKEEIEFIVSCINKFITQG